MVRRIVQPVEPRHIAPIAPDGDALLTPAEVALIFRVDPKTVTRWAKDGKLPSIRTLGGHRRYRESVVQAFLDDPEQFINDNPGNKNQG
jgi:excisionase family DNA binding protein